jgi:MYXO-CTERM domain-containing protein
MDELSGWGLGIHFPEGFSEDHLIGFPATADRGIAVAAYSGHAWFSGEPGARASYSGRGHRIDGEPILWISAPADPITAGYAEGDPAVDRVFGGTSGASPHVAGAAALLIQADPGRSGDDVREAIKRGALVDEHVGAAPNDDYGHGKLRIYESLFGEAPPGGAPPSIAVKPATVEAGEQALIPIDVADPDEPSGALVIEVDREYDGEFEEHLTSAELPVAFDDVGARVIKLRVTDSTGRQAFALADVEVLPAGKAPPPAPSVKPGGGCVAAGGGEAREPGVSALGLAALLGLFRFRRRKN